MKLFKSRKTYYLFNPNTLNYERVFPTVKDRLFAVLRHLTTGIAFGVITFFVMMHLVDTPMVQRLRKENKLLQTQYEVLSLRLNSALEVLEDLQQRDENLYRAIFQAESIPESVRKAGFGGTNRYEHLMSLTNPELVVATTQKMDMLRKQLYIQSNSLEELINLGKNAANVSRLSSRLPTRISAVLPPAMVCVLTPFTVPHASTQAWISPPRLVRTSMRPVMES